MKAKDENSLILYQDADGITTAPIKLHTASVVKSFFTTEQKGKKYSTLVSRNAGDAGE